MATSSEMELESATELAGATELEFATESVSVMGRASATGFAAATSLAAEPESTAATEAAAATSLAATELAASGVSSAGIDGAVSFVSVLGFGVGLVWRFVLAVTGPLGRDSSLATSGGNDGFSCGNSMFGTHSSRPCSTTEMPRAKTMPADVESGLKVTG